MLDSFDRPGAHGAPSPHAGSREGESREARDRRESSRGQGRASARSLDVPVAVGSFVALVAFNALSEALRLGGVTSADVSNEVFAWFAPAGYVFMIWTAIYVALAVWLVRFVRFDPRPAPARGLPVSRECALFVLSCALNVSWLALWHLRLFALTVPVIVALLACAWSLYALVRERSDSPLDWAAFSAYGSWLSVATVANVAHVLTRLYPGDAGAFQAVSTIVLLVALLVGSLSLIRALMDPVPALVVAWAGVGIGVRLLEVSTSVGVAAIALSALGAMAALVLMQRAVDHTLLSE